jgi:hypothetical protein
MIEREPIYLALFELISDLAEANGVVTVARKLRHWADVSATDQPAIFQIQRNEVPGQTRGLPTKWKLNVDLYIYVNSGDDPAGSPAKILNPILDALEALFPPSEENGQIQTLGGLASHCWISGTIETSEGVLGAQEVAIVPIEILAPT